MSISFPVVEIRAALPLPDDHWDEADGLAENNSERNPSWFCFSRTNGLKNILFGTAKVAANIPIDPQFQGLRGLGRLLLESSLRITVLEMLPNRGDRP